MFYLVQRLVRKNRPQDEPSPLAPVRNNKGRFDDLFGCEYMGSSEFEFGAVPTAFKQLQALSLSVMPMEVTRNGVTRTVYFVAADDPSAYDSCYYENDHGNDVDVTSFQRAIEAFKQWFSQPRLHSKERTEFDTLFEDNLPEYRKEFPPETVAWWSLTDNLLWSLDENIANELLRTFNLPPVT